MIKMVNIDELVLGLRSIGFDAGICLTGSSTCEIIALAGGLSVWACAKPTDDDVVDDNDILGYETLARLSE